MKITIKPGATISFDKLEPGECFLLNNSLLMMKIRTVAESYEAVPFEGGFCLHVDRDEQVAPMKAQLVAKLDHGRCGEQ